MPIGAVENRDQIGDEDLDHFTCIFCKNLVIDPHQCSNCERLACRECSDGISMCSSCDESVEFMEQRNIYVNTILQRVVLKCPLNEKCGHISSYKEMVNHHVKRCDY